MKVLIVGLGLIGGSFAKALKNRPDYEVYGTDSNEKVVRRAVADGVILGECGTDRADLIIIALYPGQTVEFIKNNLFKIKRDAVVVDSCGVKSAVCEKVLPLVKQAGFTFVGAHPMAGKEKGGYENSDGSLFSGASYIITPEQAPKRAVDVVKRLAFDAGFKDVTITTPKEHDSIIAFTSQLPHILASAYISDPDAPRHRGYSAGSYKDVSRVAEINAGMWTELFLSNKAELARHLEILIKNLSVFKDAVLTGDEKLLFTLLANGDKIKKEIG